MATATSNAGMGHVYKPNMGHSYLIVHELFSFLSRDNKYNAEKKFQDPFTQSNDNDCLHSTDIR